MKFCRQCAEYVSEHHSECPNCGYVFPEQTAGKSKYYCTRCKRQLLSKICPVHGTESTVKVGSAKPEASTVKSQFSQPQREILTSGEQDQSYFSSPLEKTLPPVSKPLPLEAKNQDDLTRPIPLSQPADSPGTQPAATVSKQPQAERQNSTAVVNPASPKSPVSPSTTPTVNPATRRQSGTLSSRPIIEGKLSSPAESPQSTLKTGAPKKPAEKKKSEHQKRQKSNLWASVFPVNPVAEKFSIKKVPGWIYWAGSFTLAVAVVMTIYFFYYPDYVKNSLFSRAEEHFQQGHHEAALELYREYKTRYPGDEIIPAVDQRINQIRQRENVQTQKQAIIYSLMQKAAECYNQQRFLKPDDDNAIMYIREILSKEPNFIPALTLQNRIVDFYFEQAEKAFDEDRYDRAVTYYENILAIRPTDNKIRADLDRALKLKYVYSMLDDMSSLADAREELKNFQKEKYRLKNQIREERRKLQEASQQLENQQNGNSNSSQRADQKSSSEEILNGKTIAAGLTHISKPGPAIDTQLLEISLNQQPAKSSEDSTSIMPDKYQIESADAEEPVRFTLKKRVSD